MRDLLQYLRHCLLYGHQWGEWRYGYPTTDSVARYNTCQQCGLKTKYWIVEPEKYVPQEKREQRHQNPPF